MPAYRVLIKPTAEKEIDALDSSVHKRISAKILGLQRNPRPPGSQKLHGAQGYRLRAGDYRILYEVDDHLSIVMIYAVGHRREVYR